MKKKLTRFPEVEGMDQEDQILVCFIPSQKHPKGIFGFVRGNEINLTSTGRNSFMPISVKQYESIKGACPDNLFTKEHMAKMNGLSADETVNVVVSELTEAKLSLEEQVKKLTQEVADKATMITNLNETLVLLEDKIKIQQGTIDGFRSVEQTAADNAQITAMGGDPTIESMDSPPTPPTAPPAGDREARFNEIKKAYPGGPGFHNLHKLCKLNGFVAKNGNTNAEELINYILDAQDKLTWKQELAK